MTTAHVTFPSPFEVIEGNVLVLNLEWTTYLEAFDRPDAVRVLNEVAPAFFAVAQRAMSERIVLSIGRLLDRATTNGQVNLALESLLPFAAGALRDALATELATIRARAANMRDHRHKALAHNDADVATGVRQLQTIFIADVDAVLDGVAAWLAHLLGPPTDVDRFRPRSARGPGGAEHLVLRLSQALVHFGDAQGRWPLPPNAGATT